jgi:hypothetical protein
MMGLEPIMNQEPSPENTNPTISIPPVQANSNEIKQSRSAVITAVVINLLLDLVGLILIFTLNSSETSVFRSPVFFLGSAVIDIVLAINMLRGKQWARTWFIIRCVGGIVIYGGISLLQKDYGTLVLNTGVLTSLIILLTGKSNLSRTGTSVGLLIVSIAVGLYLSIFGITSNLAVTPADNTIPANFETYTSEGFFSISFPADWSPEQSAIKELEKSAKQFMTTEGLNYKEGEFQIVFVGGTFSDDNNIAAVTISVEPLKLWPLETMVENTHQWYKENAAKYVEFSRTKTTINDTDAIICTFQSEDGDGILSGFKVAYVKGSKFLWTIACLCNSYNLNGNLDTFDQVVRSLRMEF